MENRRPQIGHVPSKPTQTSVTDLTLYFRPSTERPWHAIWKRPNDAQADREDDDDDDDDDGTFCNDGFGGHVTCVLGMGATCGRG